MDIARAGADKIEIESESRPYPSFSDIEGQCEEEYGELLEILHEDDLFEPVSLDRRETLVKQIKQALPEQGHALVDELADNMSRHTWLHQEAAFHLGMAVGLRIAEGRRQ